MNVSTRPAHIIATLNTVASNQDAQLSAELETYIADLEAKQPERPRRIADILKTLTDQYPAEEMASLGAYISALEANQQRALTNPTAPDKIPMWSHLRTMQREEQRRQRAIRKRNDYQ
jgi:hypothetical protein